MPGKSLEVQAKELKELSEIIKDWPKDCPQRPRLEKAILDVGIFSGTGNGIATLSSGLGTVQLYHVEKPRESFDIKGGEIEIPGKHGDDYQYQGDKSPRLELIGFIDAQSEYNAIKNTLVTMRQGQCANPITVTVRFGASAYINGVQYWLEPFEIDPEPGYGVFVANYTIRLVKRG